LSAATTNRALAAEIFAVLHAAGVRTIALCPGGRNAPLVLAAEAAGASFEVVSFFEERSAAFFALGRIMRDDRPVAVMTTSGTAAAELLPAMLEAAYSGQPLIAVTADRPRRLRDTGAPQTINQLPLFAAAGAPVLDIDAPGQLVDLPATNGPVHLNVCFDEPLVDGPIGIVAAGEAPKPRSPEPWMDESTARDVCSDFFRKVSHPLILISSLSPEDAHRLAPWLASLDCPLYLEAVSQLRGHRNLQEFSLRSGERILLAPEVREACDGVLRIGGVPTPRFWRECEGREVLHVSAVNLPGLEGNSPVVPLEIFSRICGNFVPTGGRTGALLSRDRMASEKLDHLLAAEPRSEAGLVRALSQRIAADSRLFLGNSLPIREWDLAASRAHDGHQVHANRGVNGIDGLISTALGLSGSDRPTTAVIGDLSALYDMAGLWPAAQLPASEFTLAVINNGGGKIFDRMFRSAAFLNAHQLRLRGWAEMFGWHYGVMHGPDDPFPDGSPRLVEILPDEEATRRFAEQYAALWR
jgi:2-succinyl-5-enolpyruvyl-6-hydroxy-3-cyclohexene-1-carboxylate synthase